MLACKAETRRYREFPAMNSGSLIFFQKKADSSGKSVGQSIQASSCRPAVTSAIPLRGSDGKACRAPRHHVLAVAPVKTSLPKELR